MKWNCRYLLLFIIFLLASAFYALNMASVPVDDAPITYRFAKNLGDGKGFVYNEDERVYGTTTPLYAIILSIFYLVGCDIATSSIALDIIFSSLSILVVYFLAEELQLSFEFSLTAMLLTATSGPYVTWSTAGMETPLYIFLILISLYFSIKNHIFSSALSLALVFLTRIDGAIVFIAIITSNFLKKTLNKKIIIYYAILVLPWFIFAFYYFGSIIPWTLHAKQLHVHIAPRSWMFTYFIRQEFIILLPFVIYSIAKNRSNEKWLKLIIWSAVYLFSFYIINIDYYEWYMIPTIPIFMLFASDGMNAFYSCLNQIIPPRTISRLRKNAIIILFFICIANYTIGVQETNRYHVYIDTVEIPRINAAKWLLENADTSGSVGMGAIGHIGYIFPGKIIDFAGLVTKIPVGVDPLIHFHPDYLVLGNERVKDQFVQKNYKIIYFDKSGAIPIYIYSSNNISDRYHNFDLEGIGNI